MTLDRDYWGQLFNTGIPAWSLFVAILLPFLYVLPSGFVYAYTGQSVCLFFVVFHVW